MQLDILINPIVCFSLKLLFMMTQPMRELAHLVNNRFEPDDPKFFPSLSHTNQGLYTFAINLNPQCRVKDV